MKTFTVAGQTYRVGDVIRMKTPESGLIETTVSSLSYDYGMGEPRHVLVSELFVQSRGCAWRLFITNLPRLNIRQHCWQCRCGHDNNHPVCYQWSRRIEWRGGVFVSEDLSDNYHTGKVPKLPVIQDKPTTGQLLLDL